MMMEVRAQAHLLPVLVLVQVQVRIQNRHRHLHLNVLHKIIISKFKKQILKLKDKERN